MIEFDGIIVVEGNTDEALLRTFINCEIVKTGGSAVTRGTIDYLKESSKHRKIIVLTDPDFPGTQIRNKLDDQIPNLHHAFVPKKLCIRKNKVGIAESNQEAIIDALEHLIINNGVAYGNLTNADLLELGLIGTENACTTREKIEETLHLGHTNGKTLLKRLNSLRITKEELGRLLDEYRTIF